MTYPVNAIYACIQGEGCKTGIPMVMLRLQGCDVGCSFCDTKESWDTDNQFEVATIEEAGKDNGSPYFARKSAKQIAKYIDDEFPLMQWVLVSGGEPARYDLSELVLQLHLLGKSVALETSGTETGFMNADFNWICLSPKPPYANLPYGFVNEIKWVVGGQKDIDELDKQLKGQIYPKTEICLQPISQNQKATDLCAKTAMKRGWRLSIQMHKYLNLR